MCKYNTGGWETFEKYFGHNRLPPHKNISDLFVIFLAEMIGTAIMIFIGCLGCTLVRINITEQRYIYPQEVVVFESQIISRDVKSGRSKEAVDIGYFYPYRYGEPFVRTNLSSHNDDVSTENEIDLQTEYFQTTVSEEPNDFYKNIQAVIKSLETNPTTPPKTIQKRELVNPYYQAALNKLKRARDEEIEEPTTVEITTEDLGEAENATNVTTKYPIPYDYTFEVSPIVGLSFGLGIMISTQIFAHISLAHFNPAVSLAAFILCKF